MGVSLETQGQQIGQNEVNRAEIVAAKQFYKSISPGKRVSPDGI